MARTSLLLLSIFIFIFLVSPLQAQPGSNPDPSLFPNQRQYQAYLIIQRFKRTITCDPFGVTRTWVGPRPCTYRGFYCEAPPDSPTTPTIASVDFNGFRLCAPTLEGFIDQLHDLAIFHANSNNFSGAIPDLSGLRYFYEIDLSNNIHAGSFPTTLLPLANLTFLDIRFNGYAGAINPNVFLLTLGVLFLNNNFFNQPLPDTLGRTPAAYLTLANNGFTGPIPRSIGNTSNTLLEVLFLNNMLSGCLPYEIGKLGNATVFDAGFNHITGPIPWSFGCLAKVEQLNLAGNLLYGEVPDVVCKLAVDGKLENLSLSGNYFTSLGHTCWELIKNKSDAIDVRRNCIWGLPEQRPAAECSRFFYWFPKQYCPALHYVPCRLPKCPLASTAPPKLPLGTHWRRLQQAKGRPRTTVSTRSDYVTYKMLHQPPRLN
ncbi:hypothetical protein Cni_G01311 [Canna indica]|uniref:Leucine-rich repeat-containing N-terminal plant-type domain-containing protein n=1 Tax=Canna indica TaxID=4628 RepID=A0AAQ3Q0V3_9LILI|nr:hypothetical protein Cni_G01311 [Canna indica]